MDDVEWVPLESNPKTLNRLLDNVGVPGDWRVHDVYGLEPELLAMVPQPVVALILLFPSKGHINKTLSVNEAPPRIFFMKQKVHNACGTVAMIHAVANNTNRILSSPQSKLSEFLEATKEQSPEERAEYFKNSDVIREAHTDASEQGQNIMRTVDKNLLPHFVSFVHHDGALYELDGLIDSPTNHGPTSPETLLQDAAKVCKDFMSRHPDQINFSLMALAAAE